MTTSFAPQTSTEAISYWLEQRRGKWFDVMAIRHGVIEDNFNVGALNHGISEGAVRYQLAQMIRTKDFEQRRLRNRKGTKRSRFEFRMKPTTLQPLAPTPWTVFVDLFQ